MTKGPSHSGWCRHLERRLPVSGLERCPACHPERSEGSRSLDEEILRCAQDDSPYLQMSKAGAHFLTRDSHKVYSTNGLLTNHYFCKEKDHDYKSRLSIASQRRLCPHTLLDSCRCATIGGVLLAHSWRHYCPRWRTHHHPHCQ